MGRKTLVGSGQKNLHWGNIRVLITADANFGDDRLRHFCMARGQILGFSIGFRHEILDKAKLFHYFYGLMKMKINQLNTKNPKV